MPSLQQIFEILLAVPVVYGNQTIVLQAALERKSQKAGEWDELEVKSQSLRDALQIAALAVDEVIVSARAPEEVLGELSQIRAGIKAIEGEMHQNRAQKIAFLCESWDITQTDEPESEMVPLTAETVSHFSEGLVLRMWEELEKKTGLSRSL